MFLLLSLAYSCEASHHHVLALGVPWLCAGAKCPGSPHLPPRAGRSPKGRDEGSWQGTRWILSEARVRGCLTFCACGIPSGVHFWKAQKQDPASSSYPGFPSSFQVPTRCDVHERHRPRTGAAEKPREMLLAFLFMQETKMNSAAGSLGLMNVSQRCWACREPGAALQVRQLRQRQVAKGTGPRCCWAKQASQPAASFPESLRPHFR